MHEVAFSGPAVIRFGGLAGPHAVTERLSSSAQNPGVRFPGRRATPGVVGGGGGDRPVEPDPQRPFEH